MNEVQFTYVGIDVSKDTFNFYFSGTDGKVANSRQGWQKFMKAIPAGSVCGMEATGVYHYRLASFLHSKGFPVLVFNPLRVKRHMQSLGIKAKTDKADARIICDYAQTDKAKLCKWEPMSPKLARARSIVTVLSALSKTANRCSNVKHSVSLTLGMDKTLLNPLAVLSNACREQKRALEKELIGIVNELWPEKLRLLKTIKGVGAFTASVLLVVTRGMEFATSARLSSYCGLAPDNRESGVSIKGKGHIVKVGSHYLRACLCMCAFSAVQCNATCKAFYGRLLAKGKAKFSAMTAVMHRLVKICWGVVNSGEPWRGASRCSIMPFFKKKLSLCCERE